MNAVQSHVTAAIMMNGLDMMKCEGIAFQAAAGSQKAHLSVPGSACNSSLCIPFWGRVVFNTSSIPKFSPRVFLGDVYGASMFLIPDDDYPCFAWIVPTSGDAAECNVKCNRNNVVAKMPYVDDKGAPVALNISAPVLITHEQPFLGVSTDTDGARVALVRQSVAEDPKNVRKTTEWSIAQFEKHVQAFGKATGVQHAEETSGPSAAKRSRQSDADIPSELQHVLL